MRKASSWRTFIRGHTTICSPEGLFHSRRRDTMQIQRQQSFWKRPSIMAALLNGRYPLLGQPRTSALRQTFCHSRVVECMSGPIQLAPILPPPRLFSPACPFINRITQNLFMKFYGMIGHNSATNRLDFECQGQVSPEVRIVVCR